MVIKVPNERMSIRIVDLFAGCGGLSLGFDAFEPAPGFRPFKTVLAMDNWPSAVKIFNSNFSRPDGALGDVARVADLSWFDHPSEALLYYLVHLSLSGPDRDLKAELQGAGCPDFLRALRTIDDQFSSKLKELGGFPEHTDAVSLIDPKTFSLASCKSALGKLHLRSIRDLSLDRSSLPWNEEADLLMATDHVEEAIVFEAYRRAAASLWQQITAQILGAGEKVGRGQHKNNAQRMTSLGAYFESDAGRSLQKLWCDWYARRLSLREEYCLRTYPLLRRMYNESRRVHILLGGPPCKGFSRIGRAVIRELREQGAHAWACNRFGDERNALMYRYVCFVEALQPDAFLFENVSNFASTLKTPDGELNAPQLLEELISDIQVEELHYSVDARIVSAKKHAVPQARERFLMCGVSSRVGSKSDAAFFLDIPNYSDLVTLGDAITGLPSPAVFQNGIDTTYRCCVPDISTLAHTAATKTFFEWISVKRHTAVDAHVYRKPREDDARLYRFIAPGVRWMDLKTKSTPSLTLLQEVLDELAKLLPSNSSLATKARVSIARGLLNDSLALRLYLEDMSRDLPESHHLLAPGYLSNGSGQHGDWIERLSAAKPCKTIVAHIGKDTYGYIHPLEPRPISIREAARVQSFPDWFRFGGVGVVDAYSMIGNAVPPLLSNAFARRIWSRCGPRGIQATSEKTEPTSMSHPVSQVQLPLVT